MRGRCWRRAARRGPPPRAGVPRGRRAAATHRRRHPLVRPRRARCAVGRGWQVEGPAMRWPPAQRLPDREWPPNSGTIVAYSHGRPLMSFRRAMALVSAALNLPFGYTLSTWSAAALATYCFGLPHPTHVFAFVVV